MAAAQAAVADGASVRAQFDDGQESLHVACYKGHLDIAQWLHSAGASVFATNSMRWTPLHYACWKGQLDLAQWLSSAGASVDAADTLGWTPLHEGCWHGHLKIAQWLCSAGADATLKNSAGNTPAQLLQRPDRTVQLDQQELRSTLACLVRRAQAQGPLVCPTPRRRSH